VSNQTLGRDIVLVGSAPSGCAAAIAAARAVLPVVAGRFTGTAPPVPAAAPQEVRS
jgi:thioredoxin reductase